MGLLYKRRTLRNSSFISHRVTIYLGYDCKWDFWYPDYLHIGIEREENFIMSSANDEADMLIQSISVVDSQHSDL